MNLVRLLQDSYEEISHIHDRMPVILPEEFYGEWLSCKLGGFPVTAMSQLDYYSISQDIGSPRNDYYFGRVS